MTSAVWQVQEAKNRFSEVIACALSDGPQVITRHGRAVIRVVAIDATPDSLQSEGDDGFAQYLLSAPKLDMELEAAPRKSRAIPVVLGG